MLAQLDTKTVYTFMESMVTIDAYVAKAKALGYSHIGMMDRDNLYGAYHFMEACTKAGLQALVGCEMDLYLDGSVLGVQFLALNSQGYRHLLKLSTAKMMGQSDVAELRQYMGDLAVILPYREGVEDLDLGVDYFIGVRPDSPDKEYSRPIVPLYTVRYFEEDQLESLQVLAAIKDNVALHEVAALPLHQQLLSPASLEALFSQRFPQAVANLNALVATVSYSVDKELKLPRFNSQQAAVEELRERAEAGLKERGVWLPAYQERLAEELAIIHDMGFDDYFLIVWDLLRFGRSQGYYMGMGRGSAVGSLVAYALHITGIDPVKHQLLFERFLNKERYSMPDIDIDIPDIYRGEFIRYVRDRYGSMHTAQIVTYSTFGAKQALRDVLKRYGVPEYELTAITKKISFRDTLQTAYERNASFRQLMTSKVEYQKAFEIAKQIEGHPRQTSIHAAGVVMSDADLTDTIPLKSGEDMLVTQYDAPAVEANGLLKMDFLGLRNLTFVQKMKEAVLEKEGVEIDIAAIDLEDAATLSLFASGQTKGIFQFEQPGAISLLKRVRPTCFEDIVATTSLNRPGASDYADNFVKRKHGQETVQMLDASIEAILRPTYGIMLYQEQVMQIAQVFAGFTLGRADLLRRAMSKKNAQEMQEMKASFVSGAVEKGHSPQQAELIFKMIAKFAGYGFNRSHAYAYSALAFQLAYFKTHYPAIFFDVMLNYSSSEYLTDALQFGFQVAPLTLNRVPYQDKFSGNKIYMGLKHIKGLPREFAYWIVEERPFQSVEDFLIRLPQKWQKKEWLIPLIQLGLFDDMEANRKKIISNLDSLFLFVETFGSFFAAETYDWTEEEDFTDMEKFEMEQAILGVGLSPHPLLKLQEQASRDYQAIENLVVDQKATVLVQVQSIKVIRTKKTGEQMAFLQVTDTKKKLDVTLFPEAYKRYQEQAVEGSILYISGRVQDRDAHLQLVADQLEVASLETFWILLADHQFDQEIAVILQQHRGRVPVVLHYQDSNQTLRASQFLVEKSTALQEDLLPYTMKTVFR